MDWNLKKSCIALAVNARTGELQLTDLVEWMQSLPTIVSFKMTDSEVELAVKELLEDEILKKEVTEDREHIVFNGDW